MGDVLKPKKTSARTKARAAAPAKRLPLSLRVTPQLKAKLDAAAAETGRSQTQEIEFRLEQSFDRTELIFDAVKLAYGAEGAGLILLMARAMFDAGRLSGFKNGPAKLPGSRWVDDPFAYEQAQKAAATVLKGFRPSKQHLKSEAEGDARFIENMNTLMRTTNSSSWGEWFGKNILNAVSGDESTLTDSRWIERVKEMLGAIAGRTSKAGD
jgi:predicted transcriptional regulator